MAQIQAKETEPQPANQLKFLVYGAGVIGSVYAAYLWEAGFDVTLLARGQRAEALHKNGIVLENAATGQRTVSRVPVSEHLAPTDIYDVAIIAVRMDQLASVLPFIAANHYIPTVLFMLNNPLGIQGLQQLEAQRVVLGFPGAGGTRQGEVIRYVLIRQQLTTLGEVDGRITPRVKQIAAALKQAQFPVAISHDMQGWLKTHAVFVSCITAALASVDGDSVRLGRTRANVLMMVQAIREGFRALQALGIPIAPTNLKVLFTWMPTWFAVSYWQHALQTPVGTLAIAPHANAARDEMRQVALDILKVLQSSSAPIPTFVRLMTFLNIPA
jgi:2-dehydropantoate 2-reductase